MLPLIVLLPSPLLGPESLVDVGNVLLSRGHRVTVADTAAADSIQAVTRAFMEAVPEREPVILVPHSNAGLYVPQLVQQRTVACCVFVDAALPPREGSAVSASRERRDWLAAMAGDDGRLPGWTRWWDDEVVTGLFPDDAVRTRLESAQPSLPLSYFDEEIPVPAGWDAVPSAYVAFGDTYAEEVASARGRGWPVRTLAGQHLHLLTAPDEVTDTVLALVSGLVRPG